jgi:hypothetical protein
VWPYHGGQLYALTDLGVQEAKNTQQRSSTQGKSSAWELLDILRAQNLQGCSDLANISYIHNCMMAFWAQNEFQIHLFIFFF